VRIGALCLPFSNAYPSAGYMPCTKVLEVGATNTVMVSHIQVIAS